MAGVLAVSTACSSSGSDAASSGSSGSNSSGGTGVTNVSVVEFPGQFTSYVTYAAQQEGFFAKNHLNVALTPLASGSTTTAALASGSLDIVLVDLFNIGPLLAAGQDLRLIVQQLKIGYSILTAPGVSAKDANNLFPVPSGTKFGVASLGGAQAQLVKYIQKQYGGSSVDLVTDPTGAGLSKSTEPYLLASPNIGCVVQTTGATKVASLLSSSTAPAKMSTVAGLPDNGYWTSGTWADAHPQAVKEFQTAIQQATQWASANPAGLAALLRKSDQFNIPKLSDQQFDACIQALTPAWSTSFTAQDLANWNTLLTESGVVKSDLPASSKWAVAGALSS
jgi:ABC-type nitrate/sulfonate/bicarbonate transport system substrate-binding protein